MLTITTATFRPILPPEGHHPLDFRPTLLRPKWTITLILVYFAISGGIAALLYTSGDDHKFLVSSENVQLVARYCPGLTATITNLLFRQTNRDTMRMKQYFAMADQKNTITKGATPRESIASAYFPWVGFGITPFSWLYLFLWMSNVVASFLVAFKTVLLGTRQTGSDWVLTVRSGPAHYLIGGYILMGLVNLVILVYAWSRSAGLQWDPVSIGDFIALFARCNALQCFDGLEYDSDGHGFWSAGKRRAWRRMLEDLRFHIGYWESTTPTLTGTLRREIVYGIGVLNGSTGVSGLMSCCRPVKLIMSKHQSPPATLKNSKILIYSPQLTRSIGLARLNKTPVWKSLRLPPRGWEAFDVHECQHRHRANPPSPPTGMTTRLLVCALASPIRPVSTTHTNRLLDWESTYSFSGFSLS
jgi:hypothetical protein